MDLTLPKPWFLAFETYKPLGTVLADSKVGLALPVVPFEDQPLVATRPRSRSASISRLEFTLGNRVRRCGFRRPIA